MTTNKCHSYNSVKQIGNERRQFFKKVSSISFAVIASSSLPISVLLTGCNAQFFRMKFINWSESICVDHMLATKITNEADAEIIIQWAAESGYKVRPMGKMHNWSPIVITRQTTSKAKILLVDCSKLNQLEMIESKPDFGVVKVGAGVLVEDLCCFLSNDRSLGGSTNGYAFQNIPAPGGITIAGALAIGAHGTGTTYQGSTESPYFNGSLSNTILSLRAIVWNEHREQYESNTFNREDIGSDVFLTNLGRLLITEVTMQVVPNYNLRCRSYTNISATQLFHPNKNNNPFTVANILDDNGRMEVIWFPFTDKPWLKIWSYSPDKPVDSMATTGPYNYQFSDQIPIFLSRLIKAILNGKPHLVPIFGKIQYWFVNLALKGCLDQYQLETTLLNKGIDFSSFTRHSVIPESHQIDDLWGPAWQTLLYIRESTLRVTTNGYAIHIPRNQVQTVLHAFVEKYQSLVSDFADRGLYPIAGPMEIRVTGLEETAGLRTPHNGGEPKPPALSALTKSSLDNPSVDTAIWINLLTLPGAPASDEFYEKLEIWLFSRFPAAQIRVEWSKGWGYTKNKGAWSNPDILKRRIPESLSNNERSLSSAVDIMKSYDPKNIFSNAMLDDLLK